MSTATQIKSDIVTIREELERSAKAEGYPQTLVLTGEIFVNFSDMAVWYEVKDTEYNVLSYVSLSYPRLNAHGEKLVGAACKLEAIDHYEMNEER